MKVGLCERIESMRGGKLAGNAARRTLFVFVTRLSLEQVHLSDKNRSLTPGQVVVAADIEVRRAPTC